MENNKAVVASATTSVTVPGFKPTEAITLTYSTFEKAIHIVYPAYWFDGNGNWEITRRQEHLRGVVHTFAALMGTLPPSVEALARVVIDAPTLMPQYTK